MRAATGHQSHETVGAGRGCGSIESDGLPVASWSANLQPHSLIQVGGRVTTANHRVQPQSEAECSVDTSVGVEDERSRRATTVTVHVYTNCIWVYVLDYTVHSIL